ncbi:MAG: hypothetical protein AAF989_11490 [Planctomycetota bacterium]
MAKYYVQCGPLRVVMTAESMDHAALSALDRVLNPHLWIYDDADLSEDECRQHLMLEALLHLEPTVRISEQGFGRKDATRLGTPETIDRWHRLMVGMNRLFVAAGLVPRPMVGLASPNPPTNAPPNRPR